MSSIKTQESQYLVCSVANKKVHLSWTKVQMRGGPYRNIYPHCSEFNNEAPPICKCLNKNVLEIPECLAHKICS